MSRIFDKEAALDRVDNDPELLAELIELALAEASKKLPQLEAAVMERNAKVINEIAHSMKSAFGNVGAMECHDFAFELERRGKASSFDRVEEIFGEFRSAIEEFSTTALEFKKSGSQ